MCARHGHGSRRWKLADPSTWKYGPANFITNWNQPLPLSTKLRLTARNFWIRATTPALCCGHDGEPGC